MCQVQKKHPDQLRSLSKKEISYIHSEFINLARNRSDFKKASSQNKYKVRGKFDNQIR